MPEPIIVYGAIGCEDTARTRAFLKAHQIPFQDVTIDHDPAAETFVRVINGGARSTPTVVFGGHRKTVVAEPSNSELTELVSGAGYQVG